MKKNSEFCFLGRGGVDFNWFDACHRSRCCRRDSAGGAKLFHFEKTAAADPDPTEPGWPAMIHLSIKRNDRNPIHDWRELQQFDNAALYDAILIARVLRGKRIHVQEYLDEDIRDRNPRAPLCNPSDSVKARFYRDLNTRYGKPSPTLLRISFYSSHRGQ